MIIFLFGAGASYGSGKVNPCPPPLGSNLYEALKKIYPTTWGSFELNLQSKFINNFEDGMAELISGNSHIIAPLMQRMAIFFSRFGLDSVDNRYRNLFRELVKRKLLAKSIISSLNYECLCEIAASQEGLEVEYFGKSRKYNAKIWKLHGSCNFKMEGLQLSRSGSFGIGATFNGNIKFISLNEVPKIYNGNTALYPSMCLYAKDKPLAISPGIIQKFQAGWAEKVKKANKIFVIGVRPLEEDKHIWKPIADSEGTLYFIGNKNEFQKWTYKNRTDKKNEYLGKYWEDGEKKFYSNL